MPVLLLPRSSSVAPKDVWFYNPSFALAVVGIIIFQVPIAVLLYFTLRHSKGYRHRYFVCVLIGAVLEELGYIFRAISIKHQTSRVRSFVHILLNLPPESLSLTVSICLVPQAPFILSAVLIVIAPLFVAAGLYMLLSHLIPAILPADHRHIYGISPRFLAKIFVASDIISLLTQTAGAGLASNKTAKRSALDTGKDVLMAGLALQVATISIFLIVVFGFHQRARFVENENSSDKGWKKVILGVYIAATLVQVGCWLSFFPRVGQGVTNTVQMRSVYRLIEFAMGFEGYLYTHEWPFWVFDSILMLAAVSVLCICHPAKWLSNISPYVGRATTEIGNF
jgi:hypothetical protein